MTTPQARDSDALRAEALAPVGLRQVGRQGLVYATGIVATRVIAFLMLPVYTRYLSPADYGIIQLIELTFDVISIVAGSRLAVGVFTFYHKAVDQPDRHRVLGTAFLLITGLSALMGSAAFGAAPALSDLIFGSDRHVLLFQVAAANFVVGMAQIVPFSWLRLLERAWTNIGCQLIRTGIQLVCNVVFLVHYGLGPLSILLGSLCGNLVIAAVASALMLRRTGFRFSTTWASRLFHYGLPLVGTQVATFILTFGDRYFLKAFGSEQAVGLYSLSHQFGFLLIMVGFTPFATVWEPTRFAIAKQENRDQLYARAFLYVNLLLFTMAVGISLFVEDVIRVMTTPAFHAAAAIVPIILAAFVFQAWYGIHDIGIHLREQTRYLTLVNWVAALLILAGDWLLIPRWAGLGAALAGLVSFVVRWALTYRFSQRLWPVRYQWRPVTRLFAISLAVVAGAWLVPRPLPLPLSLPLHLGFLVVYAGAVWGVVLPAEERAVLRHEPRRILNALRSRPASA